MPISETLKKQLEGFDHKTLRSLPVYTASLDRHTGTFIRTHGFLVSGVPGSNKPRDVGRVYHLGSSIMHAPYKVTDKVVKKAKDKLNACGDKITGDNIRLCEKLIGITMSASMVSVLSKLQGEKINKNLIENIKRFKGKRITNKLIHNLFSGLDKSDFPDSSTLFALDKLIGVTVSDDFINLLVKLQNYNIKSDDVGFIKKITRN
ncbi:hypothetical protein [Piscirickettsia litoralis]|uniref:Uncharacterized protein n=1 Tax=Piscirickettsia litoralis TaxID=1891921 RepID=A0ABX3A0R5_9GAMM|nr:hypothetical protein [Piscirickettsia litoralis]ODN42454.1 hypothetical protein BGC07_05300 [Piscirickettsia litoralis]